MKSTISLPPEEIDRLWAKILVTPIDTHWHKRTGWCSALEGMSLRSLQQFKAPPGEPSLDESDSEDPLPVIWKTMLSVAQTCQHIVSNAELVIRAEAARVDPGLLPPPLEIDTTVSIEQQVRPWQEVLAAIVRADDQSEYGIEEETPYWSLNPRQSQHFNKLWELASEPQTRDLFGAKRAARKAQFEFSPLESACLAFCLSLLNQRALDGVNECAMVKVLAVLGWGKKGWKEPEEYMVTLSHLIQTARWMVVARSLELANDRDQFVRKWNTGSHMVWTMEDPLDDDVFNGGLDPKCLADRRRRMGKIKGRSFLEWIEVITQAFMTRKTLGPMQWMLQLWMDSSRLVRTLGVPAEQQEELRGLDFGKR